MDLRSVAARPETTFPGRSIRQFVALQGLDRAVVLSSQAFTALIPLLILVTALAPADRSDVVAEAITRRFSLEGDSSAAVEELFANTGSGSTGVLSGFLLLFSGLSLARRLQRMYLQAWQLPAPDGMRGPLSAASGLAVLVLGIALLYAARSLVGSVLVAPVSVLAGFLVWTAVPWLLLDRRVSWRRLAPGAALTAAGTGIYGVASTIYMPALLASYSERYGLFGVTLALIGWLLCIALIIVASTAVASVLDRADEQWARRIRGGLGIRPPADVPAAPGMTAERSG